MTTLIGYFIHVNILFWTSSLKITVPYRNLSTAKVPAVTTEPAPQAIPPAAVHAAATIKLTPPLIGAAISVAVPIPAATIPPVPAALAVDLTIAALR